MSNIAEAVQWLSYTYLYIRMRSNPLVYGIKQDYWEVRKWIAAIKLSNIRSHSYLEPDNKFSPEGSYVRL